MSAPTCSICYATPEFATVKTKCGHVFCSSCFVTQVTSGQDWSDKCAICRKPVATTASPPAVNTTQDDDTLLLTDQQWRNVFADLEAFSSLGLIGPVRQSRLVTTTSSPQDQSPRRGTLANPIPPMRDQFPGYEGPWTVKGLPDKRSPLWRAYNEDTVLASW